MCQSWCEWLSRVSRKLGRNRGLGNKFTFHVAHKSCRWSGAYTRHDAVLISCGCCFLRKLFIYSRNNQFIVLITHICLFHSIHICIQPPASLNCFHASCAKYGNCSANQLIMLASCNEKFASTNRTIKICFLRPRKVFKTRTKSFRFYRSTDRARIQVQVWCFFRNKTSVIFPFTCSIRFCNDIHTQPLKFNEIVERRNEEEEQETSWENLEPV